MQGKHFRQRNKMSIKTKSIILSVVSIIELILIVTSATFSWFEGMTALEIRGSNLSTASVLNSHIELGENSSDTDKTYNNIIDLTKFYDAQKKVRLSPVSSADAENFFAAYSGTPGAEGAKYRKLTTADVNANIIRFEVDITSPDGPTDIYLSQIEPRVNINTTVYNDEHVYPYRFAFSDGESTHITTTNAATASTQKAISSLTANDTANTVTGTVEHSGEYYYIRDHRDSNKPIFHLEKDEVKTITVSIWIEACDTYYSNTTFGPQAGDNISFVLKLVTSWSVPRNLTVYDYTADQWVDNSDSGKTMTLYVRNMDGPTDARLYKLTYNSSTHTWTGKIPHALQNCEFIWKTSDNETKATWQALERGNNEIISLLGSTTYIWGNNVTQIFFKDYTSANWVNNPGAYQQAIKMKVFITHEGKVLNYSMTDSVSQDARGKNTWSCFIPTPVQEVRFDRCERSNNAKIYNSWTGTDRGEETVYRALDSGSAGEVGTYYLYVTISDSIANQVYHNSNSLAVSFTGSDNQTVINNAGTNYASINMNNYHPNTDTWPFGDSRMTRVGTSNVWYIALESKPAANTKITVWNRTANGFGTVDNNQSFGMFNFDGNNNNIAVTGATMLTSQDANGNYYLTGSLNNQGSGAGSTGGKVEKGTWGDIKLINGTYTSSFVHNTSATSVKATFVYENETYEIQLTETSSGSKVWTTNEIPDSVTTVNFTDSNGQTWTNTVNRSSTNKYFHAVSAGSWASFATIPEGTYSVFFVPFHTDVKGKITSLDIEYTYNGLKCVQPMAVYADNTCAWRAAAKSIPDAATSVVYKDDLGHTWTTPNSKTSDTKYFYATSTSAGIWDDTPKALHFMNVLTTSDVTKMIAKVVVNGTNYNRTMLSGTTSNTYEWVTDKDIPPTAVRDTITFIDYRNNSSTANKKWVTNHTNADGTTAYNESYIYCYAVDYPTSNSAVDKGSFRWFKTNEHKRVYFTKPSSGWGTMRVYYWIKNADGTETVKSAGWPGDTTISIHNNSLSQSVVCKIVEPACYLIFTDTDGNPKTEDIINATDMSAYYVSGSSNPYAVTKWTMTYDYFKLSK